MGFEPQSDSLTSLPGSAVLRTSSSTAPPHSSCISIHEVKRRCISAHALKQTLVFALASLGKGHLRFPGCASCHA